MTISDEKFKISPGEKRLNDWTSSRTAGISRQRYAMILNQKNVTPQALGKIARSLGVDVTEIIDAKFIVTENNN